MNFILKALSCPPLVLTGLVILSVFALLAAFASEAFLGLEPCILCIYQRWPYAIVAFIGLIALGVRRRVPALARLSVGLSGLVFLANSAIALYHTGVEQKWWASEVEGCAVPDFSDEPQSILQNIMSAPTGNCAEIPWSDPLIGLSMANYNVALCFGLFALCMVSFALSGYAEKR